MQNCSLVIKKRGIINNFNFKHNSEEIYPV